MWLAGSGGGAPIFECALRSSNIKGASQNTANDLSVLLHSYRFFTSLAIFRCRASISNQISSKIVAKGLKLVELWLVQVSSDFDQN